VDCCLDDGGDFSFGGVIRGLFPLTQVVWLRFCCRAFNECLNIVIVTGVHKNRGTTHFLPFGE